MSDFDTAYEIKQMTRGFLSPLCSTRSNLTTAFVLQLICMLFCDTPHCLSGVTSAYLDFIFSALLSCSSPFLCPTCFCFLICPFVSRPLILAVVLDAADWSATLAGPCAKCIRIHVHSGPEPAREIDLISQPCCSVFSCGLLHCKPMFHALSVTPMSITAFFICQLLVLTLFMLISRPLANTLCYSAPI